MAINGISNTLTYSLQQLRNTPTNLVEGTSANTPAAQGPAATAADPRIANTPDQVNDLQSGFGQRVKSAVDHVSGLEKSANDIAEQVATGKPEDGHKAVIAMEHALLTLDFTLQVRNKMLEAYQEIMKTQV